MVERRAVKILRTEEPAKFFSSGCALLDCVLGGGWARGKVINVVGDKSTGKTLLAIEACANYLRELPTAKIKYVEGESAFDVDYARTVGMPEDSRLELLDDIGTVEAVFSEVEEAIKSKEEYLIIIDSLDSLSDQAEMDRELGQATYGAAKAKMLSEGFRKLIRNMGDSKVTLFVISQVRDKIGAMAFAKQVQRSGGHALDFYSSQVLWLYEEGKIKKTVSGLERAIGVKIKARCEKNKVGWPWRECTVPIIYGYGMDDVLAALEWAAKAAPKSLPELKDGLSPDNYKRQVPHLDRAQVARWIRDVWETVDIEFRPDRRKYE